MRKGIISMFMAVMFVGLDAKINSAGTLKIPDPSVSENDSPVLESNYIQQAAEPQQEGQTDLRTGDSCTLGAANPSLKPWYHFGYWEWTVNAFPNATPLYLGWEGLPGFNTTIKIQSPGLDGKADSVSIGVQETTDGAVYYVTRDDQPGGRKGLFLHSNPDPKSTASFYPKDSHFLPDTTAFESVDLPGFFIRHMMFFVKLDNATDSPWYSWNIENDGSWIVQCV